jgi:nucleotide-binding universal stress UspA family protein
MQTVESEVKSPSASCNVFRHIVIATDFSPCSERALRDALMLASENDAELSLVHVLKTDWRYEMLESPPEIGLELIDVRQRLTAWAAELAPGQKVEPILVCRGPIARSVARVAEERLADLLVVGTRCRGGISKLALGSVAEELLRIASCPVLTVGPKADLVRQTGPPTILFATDFGKGSVDALRVAIGLAQAKSAKLVLMHVMLPMPVSSTNLSAYAPASAGTEDVLQWEASSRARCLRKLREFLPDGTKLEREPEFIVGTEWCPEGILIAARKFDAALIVMGANRAGSAKVLAHLPWTAVHEVIRSASCPVLTVSG